MPLAIAVWGFQSGRLGADPVQAVILQTGKTALVLLVLSLACTPVNMVVRSSLVPRLRRWLGLYAVFYASIHLLSSVGLDYEFNFELIRADLGDKRFALVGLAALLTLVPLAVTSTKGWARRLGENWKRVHWLVYPATILAVTHFGLQVKKDIRQPLLFGVIVLLLLSLRIRPVRRALEGRLRRNRRPEGAC